MSNSDRYDECDAGIAGGCGACEKCDPAFWLKKAKEPIASEPTFLACSNEHCPVNITGVGKFMTEGKEAHVLIYTKYGEKRNVRIEKPTYFLLRDIFRSLSENAVGVERMTLDGHDAEDLREESCRNSAMVEAT